MDQHPILPHLFRTEFSKITAVLCKHFGIAHMENAEDIASETFLAALETWSYRGVPENPSAWLYSVAKNRARNQLRRNRVFSEQVAAHLIEPASETTCDEIDLSEGSINDSQLKMLFAVCHPSVAAEAQISLALRVLCGFGIDEIASAFLTSKETVNKRLLRAKEKLRAERIKIEFPGEPEVAERLETVLTTLYLLFSEGYYSENKDVVLREDLCYESMRLTRLLIEKDRTSVPRTRALYALMCFQASRFNARKDDQGRIVLYHDQDNTRWDQELIAKGVWYLRQAAHGEIISKYHLEASIAYWYTIKTDSPEKWSNILLLYDQLLQLEYSPVAALNRIYALSRVTSRGMAIAEAEKIDLHDNHFYFVLLGELYSGIDRQKAIKNFQQGLQIAKSSADKQMIQDKLNRLGSSFLSGA